MKKMYNFLYLINIISGFFLLYNYLYVYETISNYKGLIMILVYIFYLVSTILFFRKKFLIEKIDYIITGIYLLTCISIFIFSLIYQMNVTEIFSMVYMNILLIVPHILYIIYNLVRCYKDI